MNNLKLLQITDNGIFLGDRKLRYITDFKIQTKADWEASHLIVKGIQSDTLGNPVIDERSKELVEYNIDTLVIVDNLDNMRNKHYKFKPPKQNYTSPYSRKSRKTK